MGLLDEAIREHLELKRRRGGNPTEIAREEREALDPIFPEAAASEPTSEPGHGAEPADPVGSLAHGGQAGFAEAQGEPADFSSVGEETAELDMQAVLQADEQLTEEHAAPASASGREASEFDWEAPRGTGGIPPVPDPGQERLSFE